MDTETVTTKITLTIRGIHCNEFTEESKDRFRNEVIGVHIHSLLRYKIVISFFMSSNIIGDKLLLI